MLILIGVVPTAFALNRALPESQGALFEENSAAASNTLAGKAAGYNILGDPRPATMGYVARHQITRTRCGSHDRPAQRWTVFRSQPRMSCPRV